MTTHYSILSYHNKLIRFGVYFLVTLIISCASDSRIFAANGVNIDSSKGLAIHGYDPVAYFTQSKAIEGKKEFTVEYQANKWALSSAANKQAFLADPE